MAEPAPALAFRPVTAESWGDLARLFESRGGPSYCWCMLWRRGGGGSNDSKRAALRGIVEQGTPVGLLAYEDGEPVAWCSIAPRESYRSLGGPADPGGVSVWSVACFFATRRLRGRGITGRLLRAAVELAGERGADVVEGYPVDPESPSYRFMGLRSTFRQAGFTEVGTAGRRRHVMRLELSARPTAGPA